MTAFQKKTIDDKGIGERLREAREDSGLSQKDVEKATRVTCKYIQALETHDFGKLPETVYAKNFVRALSRHYGLDPDVMTDAFMRETAAMTGKDATNDTMIERLQGRRLVSTPAVIKVGMLGVAFLAVVGYFAFSVHSILKPPKLVVHTPQDSQVFDERQVTLEGETEPEVELTVNQEAVLIEADGTFKETLNLPEGVSILRIAAKKRHSKAQEVYLKVVVEPPEGDAPADDGSAPEDDNTVAQR